MATLDMSPLGLRLLVNASLLLLPWRSREIRTVSLGLYSRSVYGFYLPFLTTLIHLENTELS